MPNQYQRGGAGNASHTPRIPLAPGLALTMWNPFLSGHAEALGGLSTIAHEWQDFLGRRLKEDVALMQRLSRSIGTKPPNAHGVKQLDGKQTWATRPGARSPFACRTTHRTRTRRERETQGAIDFDAALAMFD